MPHTTAKQPAEHPPRGPRSQLLPIAGGYDPARLPLGVIPADDEPASSWLRRSAAKYHLRARTLLDELGITCYAWTPDKVQAALEPHHDVLRAAFNLEDHGPLFAPSRTATALSTALDNYLTEYAPRRRGRPGSGTRYCPHCLRDRDGAWRHEWRSPLALVCPDHEIELLTTCPRCEAQPWTNSAWLNDDTPGWICVHTTKTTTPQRTRLSRCGYDLREAPTATCHRVALKFHALLGNMALLAVHDPAATGEFVGHTFTYRDAFDAVMELLDAATTPHGSHSPGSGPFTSSSSPAATTEALLKTAVALVSSDVDSAITTIGAALDPWSKQAPVRLVQGMRQTKHNPILEHVVLRAHGASLAPTLQLTCRIANDRPRYPTNGPVGSDPTAARPGELRLAWIPQVLWDGALPGHEHTDGLDRAVVSMLLARLGSTRSWQHIAVEMLLPAAFRTRPPARLRTLKKTGQWPDALKELDDFAEQLAQEPPPIDYQRRRRLCADGDSVLAAVNEALTDHETDHSAVAWAQYFWQEYTGGDARLAPQPLRTSRMLNVRRFDVSHAPELLQHIRWILEEATLTDTEEPFAWAPP